MAKTYTIELPFFPGFYESSLYSSDTLYDELANGELEYLRERYEDESLDYDDFDLDFDRYCKDCCKAFVDAFRWHDALPSFVKSMKFDHMSSPQYYNFSTDRVYAEIELEDDWRTDVLAFMAKNKEWLAKQIKTDWTSYDGFMSFMDNDYDAWVNRFQCEDVDDTYIECMIGYMMVVDTNVDDLRWNLIYDTLDGIYLTEYITCPKYDNADSDSEE